MPYSTQTLDILDALPKERGNKFYVDASKTGYGSGWADAAATIAEVLARAVSGDVIYVAPGSYDEELTNARTRDNITIIGVGGRGAAFIAPEDADSVAFTNHADDVTFVNIGLDGEDSGGGLVNTGSRVRLYGCKLEGGAYGATMTLGTVVQEAAGTHGVGADCLFVDCEFAWTTNGVLITCTDYGAVTQLFIRKSKYHNCTNSINESVGSGGSAAVMFQNLEVSDCTFDDLDDGTAPTSFILLNDDNANTGIVTGCRFPTALAGGKNLVSTALHWVANYHTDGVSTTQPS